MEDAQRETNARLGIHFELGSVSNVVPLVINWPNVDDLNGIDN